MFYTITINKISSITINIIFVFFKAILLNYSNYITYMPSFHCVPLNKKT